MYPQEVLAKSKKGKIEVRSLIDRGSYVRYEYLDPKTGERSEEKVKLILRRESGEMEEYFIIPLKQEGRYLMLRTEAKGGRKVWNRGKVEDIF
ncbi:MAG: hypothetical protein DRO98_06560 [Archaeoglobales archaeon]|nr:MAG: hypothetical protein DRO98_06560 [Archaeoglobales archaeon]